MSSIYKQQYELDTFRRFVEITGVDVDISTIMQLSPPAPDIVCKISGGDYGFELTALTDKVIERKIGTLKSGYSNFRIDIIDAVERIKTKNGKHYNIQHVDLVLHEASSPIDDLWIWNKKSLDSALQNATDNTKFMRVWVIDFSNEIIRCYNNHGILCDQYSNTQLSWPP